MTEETTNEIPEGCVAINLSGKQMEKYELKNGPTLFDTIDFKEFDAQWAKDEIVSLGVYALFNEVSKQVKEYPGEKILIVADKEQKYGENWIVCVTEAAREGQLNIMRAAELAKEEAERKIREEAEAKRKAEEAIENAVYEDKPIIPRPYTSETFESTVEEVDVLTVKHKRPLISLTISRQRREFGQQMPGLNSNKEDDNNQSLRSHKDPNYELTRMELDKAIQAVPELTDNVSQTTWFRKVNRVTQYENAADEAHDKEPDVDEPEELLQFLRNVRPLMEEALQQNETLDIFMDEFALLGDEDMALGNKAENHIKVIRTFTDLEYSKNKSLPAIDWHPRSPQIVAVAAVSNDTFDQRVEKSGQVFTSYLLIWNFTDLIHPQLMLESPHDTFAFRFNPTMPHIIVGGCISGQVLMWNTKDAEELLTKRNKKGHNVQDEDRDKTSPPVKHESISHIDSSHKRPVGDLVWLPPGIEVNNRGKISYNEDDLHSYQFLTVAGDGQTLIWDIRYKEQVKSNPRMYNLKPEKPGKDGSVPEAVWVPLFRASLTKLEGVGELGLCQVALNMVLGKHALIKAKEQVEDQGGQWSPCISDFFCATEEGEFVFADLDPSSKATSSGKEHGEEEKGHSSDAPEFVKWISQDHFRPCVTLQRSPFFPDIILSVGDWTFNIWKADVQTPIFSAPLASSYLTCGRWSPTRPGVIFIARTDGCVDVWDLSDQSHKATMSHPSLAACAITSMEFWHHNNGRQQLVAVADVSGNLHILEIPRNLWRAHNNEETIMENFFHREVRRVEYSEMRDEVRQKEKEENDAESTNAPVEISKEDEERAQRALEEKAEAEYRAMEAAFMEELGVPSTETVSRPTDMEGENNAGEPSPEAT